MNEFYWQIELWDGETIRVKPEQQKIKLIQDKIAKGEGSITTPTRSISIKNIKDFRVSDEIYQDQKLIEGAAQAFNEPQYTPEGGVKARWVKKAVPRRRWERYYKYIPAYRLLEDNENSVLMAYILPIHQIDNQVLALTQDEELRLARF